MQLIAADYGIKERTAVNNLWKYIRSGGCMDSTQLLRLSELDPNMQQKALDAMTDLGTDWLRPLFEHLEANISYDELRILRIFHELRNRQVEKRNSEVPIEPQAGSGKKGLP